jgi:pimeloyl-ACP methyl ester carboxylesterase
VVRQSVEDDKSFVAGQRVWYRLFPPATVGEPRRYQRPGSPAVAVGTSAGATIALDLAVRRPDLVRRSSHTRHPGVRCGHPSGSALGTLARMRPRPIPTATVHEIDGAAHAVAFDAPGAFVQVIVEAIRSTEFPSDT